MHIMQSVILSLLLKIFSRIFLRAQFNLCDGFGKILSVSSTKPSNLEGVEEEINLDFVELQTERTEA